MIVAILRRFKAGAAYVPKEIDLPVERMRHILRENHARTIFRTPNQVDLCRQCNVPFKGLG